ncbi:GGDEF domain-containing protein [Maritimibacter sp. HL-12]|jgi:diguanylate cyclase (GGDEF)-like protein|uniref:GGDEF domain-containing protein n=1 Tax=Maritimibacter sp. HL-12 TaxID=1162418 RepID=UPI000A0F27B2|nr:GGDEF domain-containing protein [Maritimibacter sp. HL-12]SMH33012.1 diguanylate cyclase (GGDEF) domain-containing protein [Maritimibacter sp. HL-12]
MQSETHVCLDANAFDILMPMHVVTDRGGIVTHAGPVVHKIHPAAPVVGAAFFDLFEARRPRRVESLDAITERAGKKLHLRLRDPARTPLIGTAVRLQAGQGVLVNLSFGIAVIDAVARFGLAGSDFAATDLTLEMLYLVEAKSAAMAESRKLNERLHGAKTMAEAEARSDTLTGLSNRRALDHVLERLIARQTPFTLMHLDLDFFKQVNDTLGHAAGDLVLTEVARILREESRAEDEVVRVGGDEFVIVFKGITDEAQMLCIAERMIGKLEEPVPFGTQHAQISASIGLVRSSQYALPEAARMMRDADAALYASKSRGRAQCTFFDATLEAHRDAPEAPPVAQTAPQRERSGPG